MTLPLEGRVAVVTGAARGIGDAHRTALAGAGARVFSLDMIAPDAPRQGVTDIRTDVTVGGERRGRLRRRRSRRRTDRHPRQQCRHPAGRPDRARSRSTTGMAVINTHLTGFFLCASEAVPRMVKRGKGGAIVSIASTAAFVGLPGRGPYCAAKAGILGLTRALSHGGRRAQHPRQRRRARLHPHQADRAGHRRRLDARGLDARARADEAPGDARGDRRRGASSSPATTPATSPARSIVVDGGWTVQGMLHAPDWLDASRVVKG